GLRALERVVRRNLAVDPARRDASAAEVAGRLQRWWGAALPRGTVTLVQADVGEDAANEVARAQRGHCVSPAGDGPLLLAFASAQDGFEAARGLAACGGRAAAVTGEAETRAGSYPGEVAAAAARLLKIAGSRQALIDDTTATAVDGRLPPEIGLAELAAAWVLVAPG